MLRSQVPESQNQIDERTQLVLQGIIDSYIETTEPVGSRTLSKQLATPISPATIRNIMSDLAELGFLTQTHTSAGRIPTGKAFRYYVDSLAVADSLTEELQSSIQKLSAKGVSQVEELLSNTTKILANLTQFACLVTAPKTAVSRLQRIEFIKVSTSKILVILVSKSGVVRNKIIEMAEEISQDFLNSISAFLNEQFQNRSFQEIRDQILESMVEDKERYDRLLAQAVRLGKKAFEVSDPPELYMDGHLNLLMSKAFGDHNDLRGLMSTFERKGQIMEVLDSTMQADGVRIYIGVENTHEGLRDCTLVTANYRNENNILGTLGVIGPIHMDYQRIIPVVDYTSKILSQAITRHSYD